MIAQGAKNADQGMHLEDRKLRQKRAWLASDRRQSVKAARLVAPFGTKPTCA